MKLIKALVFSLFFCPMVAFSASSDFMTAAQLLAAAKNADIAQVQSLINAGADVNFVDATGISIVCTALMNNDVRAAQILQMYGADASQCDAQIKRYNNRNKAKGGGGLFSGLSSAQSMTLAAAGAAVVVGGLLLLTDVFDPGNDNDSVGSGGDRPNNNGGNGNTGTGTAAFTVPYGPAYLTPDGKITTSTETYAANLAGYNPSAGGIRELDFNYFRPLEQAENNYFLDKIYVPLQNYMLMMHGYSALANGYQGQGIFRDESTRNPVLVANDAGGKAPVSVGLITGNGLNPTGSAARATGIQYTNSAAANADIYTVDKYRNYANPSGGALGAEITGFDLSGTGTAMNPFATSYDSALGKIVAGWESGGRAYGDLYGFVPNGQLGIYRTGNGQAWVNVTNPTSGTVVGTLTDGAGGKQNVIEAGDTITIGGHTYEISLAKTNAAVVRPTITINGTIYDLTEDSKMMKGVCTSDVEGACENVSDIAIYVGTDGYYYVNTSGGNTVDAVYVVNNNNIYAQKELQNVDYKNFEALYNARSGSAVIANASVIAPSRSTGYLTVKDMPALLALGSLAGAGAAETFVKQINSVYDRDNTSSTSQGVYANQMFGAYSKGSPILVMPAGEFAYGSGDGKSLSALDATFENYAPVLYDSNLEHMFMTVVAVRHIEGTADADSIAGYGNGTGSDYGPLYLSWWQDTMGTLEDTSDDVKYMSRKCGMAGLGINGIDPWCFSAAGATSEMAVSAAAGAVASLKAAFDYMTNSQIFMLMALTADGYLLGTDASGVAFTNDTLAAYLQAMYSLPPEYNTQDMSSPEYLRAFADVYGYGLINLDRATTPNKSVYFFDGTNIVSADGNAYWRMASNTKFKPSSVLNVRGAKISAPFYDVLESVDGQISLPRVWKNEFALGTSDKRGLYMGDVLGDMRVRNDDMHKFQIGNLGFSMAVSDKAYADNLGGLDNLTMGYTAGNWNFGASYQRYLTDGRSRFDGVSNPVLGLASNAIMSDVEYVNNDWTWGVRAFSGAITDEGLLESDPTISSQYMPAKLGLMQGAMANMKWGNGALSVATSIGMAHETDTLLGAQTDGLLNLGAGDTTYLDFETVYKFADNINLIARATVARTTSDVNSGDFVLGMTDIDSNAWALGANIGNFELAISRPLAITDGALKYAYAEYDVVMDTNNNYQLNVVDTHVAELSLRPDVRETRFVGTYRHKFGEFTDGAFGFIYRINPNHTDAFGNESIFMIKLHHRLGI